MNGDRVAWAGPVLIGASGGLRSCAPLAVLAARGAGPFPGPARFIAWGAGLGEVIADMQPDMNSRWAARGMTLRLGTSVLAGRELGGTRGAVLAAGTAVGAAYAGSRLRAQVPPRRGARWAAAITEDLLAYALASTATG